MPSFHAGQRGVAGHLNALTEDWVEISGSNIGATETALTGALIVPAAPLDRLVRPFASAHINPTSTGDRFRLRIRSDSVSGTVRASHIPPAFTSTNPFTAGFIARPFLLPANTPATLVVTAERLSGSGTISTAAGADLNSLAATLSASTA